MRYFYDTEFLDTGSEVHLISIGIVAEDGREYYAVNRHAPWDAIAKNDWLMKNVVPQLPPEPAWSAPHFIRNEVHSFLTAGGKPDLWAWFSAYDHLCLSQLWGRMIDVPAPMPQYTNDVRALSAWTGITRLPAQVAGAHDALQDAHHVKTMHDHIMRKVSTK
ncbi:3'-5' exoribonuclease domain-containing protein [Glutamicibacter sp. AOP5-A2-7]